MEKYILTMKNAEQQGKQIADRVQRFARDLYEIDTGTIFSVDYRVMRKEELVEAFTTAFVPMCQTAINTIQSATDEAADFIKHIDMTDPADLSTALQIINGPGEVKQETIDALAEVFRGRRQCQIILNSALAARNLETLPVFSPVPLIAAAAAAIEAASHFTNPADLFRELLNAQRAFNKFFEDSGTDYKAAWNLPEDEIMEAKLRAAMGITGGTSGEGAAV